MKFSFSAFSSLALATALLSSPVSAARTGLVRDKGNSMCWSVVKVSSTEDQTGSHISPVLCDKDDPKQVFTLQDNKLLKHIDSGKCVDGQDNASQIYIKTCDAGRPAQKWGFKSASKFGTEENSGSCAYQRTDATLGKVLDTVACGGVSAQYRFVPFNQAPQTGLIRDKSTGMCWSMVVLNANIENENGSHISPKACNMLDQTQVFTLKADGKQLVHVRSGRCVDGQDYASKIYMKTCTAGRAAQKWDFKDAAGKFGTEETSSTVSSQKSCVHQRNAGGSLGQVMDSLNCGAVSAHYEFVTFTQAPSSSPSISPSNVPSSIPSAAPSKSPSDAPTTASPSQAPSPATTQGTPQGSMSGDPHVKTWGGHKFDFHGGCDLVLVANSGFANGLGLTVHVRTVIETWWSYIQVAVVKIGDDTLEVMGGKQGGKFWVNGMEGTVEDIHALAGFQVTHHRFSEQQERFRIDLGNGDAMSLEYYKRFVQVNIKAKNSPNFQNSVGLMGSYPSGDMVARDGTTVLEDPIAFGLEWQVRSEPMLFHDLGEGVHHPETCALPTLDASAQRRRLGESSIKKEDAEAACARVGEDDRDACIFDVLATNDKDMAGSY